MSFPNGGIYRGVPMYKERLVQHDMLSLMYILGLNDIFFRVKALKASQSEFFNLRDYITFSKCSTRSGSAKKMNVPRATTNSRKHFYLNRLPKLWNSLPPIDLDLSLVTIKQMLKAYFTNHFTTNFISVPFI